MISGFKFSWKNFSRDNESSCVRFEVIKEKSERVENNEINLVMR